MVLLKAFLEVLRRVLRGISLVFSIGLSLVCCLASFRGFPVVTPRGLSTILQEIFFGRSSMSSPRGVPRGSRSGSPLGLPPGSPLAFSWFVQGFPNGSSRVFSLGFS